MAPDTAGASHPAHVVARRGMTHADKPGCARCRDVEQYVAATVRERGYSPSYREIMAGCRLSNPSLVAYHLAFLVDAGRLTVAASERGEWLPRTLRPPEEPPA
jgi:hypothetical protein